MYRCCKIRFTKACIVRPTNHESSSVEPCHWMFGWLQPFLTSSISQKLFARWRSMDAGVRFLVHSLLAKFCWYVELDNWLCRPISYHSKHIRTITARGSLLGAAVSIAIDVQKQNFITDFLSISRRQFKLYLTKTLTVASKILIRIHWSSS